MDFFFSAINLWCSKNLVDLEYVIWNILSNQNNKNIKFFEEPENNQVKYLIINTCWFLSSSRDEAEETIRYYDNLWKKIILMWCYIPVRDDKFLSSLKNLHKIIPQKESEKSIDDLVWNKNSLESKIKNFKENKLKDYLNNLDRLETDKKAFVWSWKSVRLPFNSPYWHEFVKISEWCDNRCSFCIIPKIRWDQKSRSIEDIIEEIKKLVWVWVKEIEIISQDTTRYWTDLYDEAKLFELLEKIDQIDLDFKFRIFYLYPDILTFEHLKKLKKLKKFIPYFDLPFQHISEKILKRMWRFYNQKHILDLLDFIKKEFPNCFLHTNYIVWFPWEWEKEFEELIDFTKKYEFDSISMFGYHDEPLAWSSKLDEKVSDLEIQERVKKIWKVIENIYKKKEKERIWKIFSWYVYDFDEKFIKIRWELKAPEIDELDEVKLENIISWEIEVWEVVEYRV